MTEKTHLVISNHWHNPGINIIIKHDSESPQGSIHVEMSMEDFMKALAKELKHPICVWSRKKQTKELKDACTTVLEKAKQATNQVM